MKPSGISGGSPKFSLNPVSRVSFGMGIKIRRGICALLEERHPDENKSDLVVNTRTFHPALLPRNARGMKVAYTVRLREWRTIFRRWNSPGPHFSWFSETIRASEFQIWRLHLLVRQAAQEFRPYHASADPRVDLSRISSRQIFLRFSPSAESLSLSSRKRLRAVRKKGR